MRRITVSHLGFAGLRITCGGAVVTVDPPTPSEGLVVVTWSERERTDGARASRGPLVADPAILRWLGRDGLALGEGEPVIHGDVSVRSRVYQPIPYATPPEALRKTWSAVRSPAQAVRRVAFTLGRPDAPPRALALHVGGARVVLLQQALHRFVGDAERDALVAWAGPCDVAIAGPDYDDEPACGRLLGAFDAGAHVVADLTGEIRRRLSLPVRPLAVALAAAPPGAVSLEPGGRLTLGGPARESPDAQ